MPASPDAVCRSRRRSRPSRRVPPRPHLGLRLRAGVEVLATPRVVCGDFRLVDGSPCLDTRRACSGRDAGRTEFSRPTSARLRRQRQAAGGAFRHWSPPPDISRFSSPITGRRLASRAENELTPPPGVNQLIETTSQSRPREAPPLHAMEEPTAPCRRVDAVRVSDVELADPGPVLRLRLGRRALVLPLRTEVKQHWNDRLLCRPRGRRRRPSPRRSRVDSCPCHTSTTIRP